MLNSKIRYFQFLWRNDGCCCIGDEDDEDVCGWLFFVMNNNTIITNDIWNRLTVNNENQNSTISTKTNDDLSQIDLRTCVILIANLKFLLTISIRHSLNNISNFNPPLLLLLLLLLLCYNIVITHMAINIK